MTLRCGRVRREGRRGAMGMAVYGGWLFRVPGDVGFPDFEDDAVVQD